jgi:creatinine amidohydrolase
MADTRRKRAGKRVQYELMMGREAPARIRAFPVGYLPIGCLERHGDHLPLGLDVIKAHKVCCAAARAIGGVVFPPHYYAGIHRMSPEQTAKYTGEWGNLYTDATARKHLTDIIRQIAIAGIRVLVLYTGHYPTCHTDMVAAVSADFADHPTLTVIPFWESMIMAGDHAGRSETSFLLHLDRDLVDLRRISARNYRDHGWNADNSPEKATRARGRRDTALVIAHLRSQIAKAIAGRQASPA